MSAVPRRNTPLVPGPASAGTASRAAHRLRSTGSRSAA